MPSTEARLVAERRVSRIVFGCMVAGFLVLVAAGAAAAWTAMRSQTHTHWVEHTYDVQQQIAEFRTAVEHVEAARRGYLLARNPDRLARYRRAVAPPGERLASVAALTGDNPAQQRAVAVLRRLEAMHHAQLAASVALAARDPAAAAARFETDGSLATIREIRTLSATMLAAEHRLLAQRVATQRGSVRLLLGLLALALATLTAVATLSIMALRRYTHGLLVAREAVEALNAELETRVEERTTDLRRANEEIQRFAYIVSHDLRSPLVNVMGFTGELEAAAKSLSALVDAAEREAPTILTEDARVAAREDLPESLRFIRTSTQKMDRLINAILRLSREGKRVLTAEPLDLPAMADGIVASLRHRLDGIGAEIAVRRPMPALVADRLATEQMLSNLIENAVKYLDPARPGRIEVSARTVPGGVGIAVADNGRGIDPRDHDRIFDLFRRSGAQDQPGEGIGLAHVRALAYRLGGFVRCASTLGEGATFTLTLPARPLAPPPEGPRP